MTAPGRQPASPARADRMATPAAHGFQLNPLPASLLVLSATAVAGSIGLQLGSVAVFLWAPFVFAALALSAAGALIATRHPENAIGWIFSGFGLFSSLAMVAGAYGIRAGDFGWPGGSVGQWIGSWSWLVEFSLWPIILMLFPNGRPPSRRWAAVAVASVAGGLLAVPGYALSSGAASQFVAGRNPFAIASPLVDLAFALGPPLLVAAMLAAVVSLALRFRRSVGVERQQLKWVAYAATIFGLCTLIAPFPDLWRSFPVVQAAFGIAYTFIPIAAGIAILRYRLYDIDIVIRRTLVYSALTLVLGGSYAASVLGFQALLSPFTANDGIAVAVSTLAVAALFGPARQRIQRAVDRRFYRSRYDAQRILEAFATRLRDEVDVDSLTAALRAASHSTVRPVTTSVWLRADR